MGSVCSSCMKMTVAPLGKGLNNCAELNSNSHGPARIPSTEELKFSSTMRGRISALTSCNKADSSPEVQSAEIINKEKSETDIKTIIGSLEQHFILKTLGKEAKLCLLEHMKYYIVGPKQVIFSQGNPAKNFFVLVSGKLEVIINGARKRILKTGSGFGELALLEDRPRTATIRTVDRSCLWGIDRAAFKSALKQVTQQQAEENKKFIENCKLFSLLTVHHKDALVDSMVTQVWDSGRKIVSEGEAGDLFYIVKEGSVVCSEKGREVRKLAKGQYFGELALLYNSPRTATVTALTDVKLLSIDRENLVSALGGSLEQVIYRNTQRISMGRSEKLRGLSEEQIEALIDQMTVSCYTDGDPVIDEGVPKATALWIVLKGAIRSGTTLLQCYECVSDEQLDLDTAEVFEGAYFAQGDTHIARILRPQLEEVLGGTFEQIVNNNELFSHLRQVQIFKSFTVQKLWELMGLMLVQEYSDQDFIVEENTPGSSFFIIRSGDVDIVKDNVVLRTIRKFHYFGERSLLFDELRGATVRAQGRVECWVLDKQHFFSAIDANIQHQLVKRLLLQSDSISLSDLVAVCAVTSSPPSQSHLAVHKTTKIVYYLKSVLKEHAVAYQSWERLAAERRVLLELDHTMIVKLIKTFKDSERVYFLLEFVRGLDLFEILQGGRSFTESESQFYICALIVILEYLHERDIVYRGLRPETIIIDEEGYPKLTDFSAANIVQGKTYTALGTPHYMAPEVILGRGYGLSADWWNLGVVLYEILFAQLPFGGEEQEPQAIYECVLEHHLVFPSTIESAPKTLVQQLLSKNPNTRTGGSVSRLKGHSWLRSFDWNKLIVRQLPPPFIPPQFSVDALVGAALQKADSLPEVLRAAAHDLDVPVNRGRIRLPPGEWDSGF